MTCCLRIKIDLGPAEQRSLSNAGRKQVLKLVGSLYLGDLYFFKLFAPTRFVKIKAVQLHFGDRHDAFELECGNIFKPVGLQAFGDLFAKLRHYRGIPCGVFDL